MTLSSAADSADSPLDQEDVRSRVQKALDDFLARQAAVLEDVSEDLSPLTDAAGALMSGGKRLRPAFCYWAWRGAGGGDVPEIIEAAAALELFQAAAIVHDDLMDGSDTRRGLPAAHRRFAALHRASGHLGPADRFGQAGAILLGDLFLSWCDEMFMLSGLPVERLMAARGVFDTMRTQLMGGQYLDMLEQVRGSVGTVERARTVIRYKSAKYTVEQPMLLGARLAAATEATLRGYSSYGLPLGEAFQLRDDLLGVFGDPDATGKPAGDDLREGKRTVLVATALERASRAQAAAVRRRLGDADLDDAGVRTLREIILDTGAVAAVERMIEELTAQATAALEAMDLANGAADVFAGLVAAATVRSV